jgi:ribosomal protein S18 acetylase RimI-like enzyme
VVEKERSSQKNRNTKSLEKSLNEIRVEPIKISDIGQFIAIAKEAIRDEIIPEEFKGAIEDSIKARARKYYETAFFNPQKWSLLAAKDTDGKIFGILEAETIGKDNNKVGLVHLIGVSKAKRRQGVATNLYQTYESILRNRGDVLGIMAGIYNTNFPSIGLHEKFGMTKSSIKLMDRKGKAYYKAL